MKISVLQPKIIRGDIDYNGKVIQDLIRGSRGELLILPEYSLTGSLVLDVNADINSWVTKSNLAKSQLEIPKNKQVLINTLIKLDNHIYNVCELLPSNNIQFKLFPDEQELNAGITPGKEQKVFELSNKKFKTIICTDLRYINEISTDNLDFLFFIFHFTDHNFEKAMQDVKNISIERKIPIIISSLVSDKNIGFSSYVNQNTIVSLSGFEGIIEIEID
ncbi:carbon-nitrogen hydrolase family protein [Alkaliphilus peptidifermentans]|uniref:Predicted amidohydrolase n=1 Tax=Alkaliphilus peptidifermentans DSM 18978 TaxID=1120976 RepID=A0A1G5K920_9FIRM|nr:carbon-nitrogen hydrolase family protein [Alkaliphilus peptidifermentans]SCY96520.1 Predicted amidohydrolase [Alkaliphilus peptidifermentans DSM 18978]